MYRNNAVAQHNYWPSCKTHGSQYYLCHSSCLFSFYMLFIGCENRHFVATSKSELLPWAGAWPTVASYCGQTLEMVLSWYHSELAALLICEVVFYGAIIITHSRL